MRKTVIKTKSDGNELFLAIKNCIDSARNEKCDKDQSIRFMSRAILLIINSGLSINDMDAMNVFLRQEVLEDSI